MALSVFYCHLMLLFGLDKEPHLGKQGNNLFFYRPANKIFFFFFCSKRFETNPLGFSNTAIFQRYGPL